MYVENADYVNIYVSTILKKNLPLNILPVVSLMM